MLLHLGVSLARKYKGWVAYHVDRILISGSRFRAIESTDERIRRYVVVGLLASPDGQCPDAGCTDWTGDDPAQPEVPPQPPLWPD